MLRINPKPKILVTELLMITAVFSVLIYAWLYAQQDNVEVKGKIKAQSLTIKGGTVLPASPVKGEVFYNSADNKFYAFNSTAWQAIGAGGAGVDKTVAGKIVAAANSNLTGKTADYICSGTNDQNLIQAAIDALNTTAGAVYLLEGTYNLSGAINLNNITPDDSGKAIIGTGKGTVLKVVASATFGVINATSVSRILISQLAIDGNKAVVSGSNRGIYFNRVINSKIDKVWVENMKSDGIYFNSYCNDNALSNNNIQSNSGNGTYFYYSNNNNTVVSNNVRSNSGNGIYLDWSDNNNIISSNNIQSNGDVGINVGRFSGASSNNTICGNIVQGTLGEAGIQLFSSSNNNIVSGNSMQSSSGYSGIRVCGSDNNIISANNMQNSSIWVECNPSNNNVVSGNMGSSLIGVGNDANNNIISSNIFRPGGLINIAGSACDNNYIVGNLISTYNGITDSGTNTTYTDWTKITLARASIAQNPGSGGIITPGPYTYIPLNPASAYALSATTPIAAGNSAGDLLILENINATNIITVPDSGNTRLRGPAANKALSSQEMLTLVWDGFNATCCWVQTGGKD